MKYISDGCINFSFRVDTNVSALYLSLIHNPNNMYLPKTININNEK